MNASSEEGSGTGDSTRREFLRTTAGVGMAVVAGVQSGAGQSADVLQWEFETGDRVRSSPTVVDDTVYVGSIDRNLYALNADDGEEVWSQDLDGAVASSPTVVDDRVFVGSDNGSIYALDAADGSQIWEVATGGNVRSSPTVSGGRIFVGSNDGTVYALAGEEGQELWTHETQGEVHSSPTVVDGTVYIASEGGNAYALSVEDGSVEWEAAVGSTRSSPTVAGDTVFIGSDDSTVVALSTEDGSEVWTTPTGGQVRSSPTYRSGVVFVGSDDGMLYALDGADGSINWEYDAGDGVRSSPTFLDGTVYVGTDGGDVLSIDADGTENWFFDAGPRVRSSPTVVDGELFVGSTEGTVYTLSPFTTESSEGNRVMLGTLGHHHAWADEVTALAGVGGDGGGGGISIGQLAIVGGGGVLAALGGYALWQRIEGGDREERQPVPSARDKSASGSGRAGSIDADEPFNLEEGVERVESLLAGARQRREATEYDVALESCQRAIDDAKQLKERASVKAPHRVSEIDPSLDTARELREEIEAERDAYRDAWNRLQNLTDRLDRIIEESDPAAPEQTLTKLNGFSTKMEKVEDLVADYDLPGIQDRIAELREEAQAHRDELVSTQTTTEQARGQLQEVERSLEDASQRLENGAFGAAIQLLDEIEVSLEEIEDVIAGVDTPRIDDRLMSKWDRWEHLRVEAQEAGERGAGEPDRVPGAPRLSLAYDDIQRLDTIDASGMSDVYSATVPSDDGDLYVAVKEPRMEALEEASGFATASETVIQSADDDVGGGETVIQGQDDDAGGSETIIKPPDEDDGAGGSETIIMGPDEDEGPGGSETVIKSPDDEDEDPGGSDTVIMGPDDEDEGPGGSDTVIKAPDDDDDVAPSVSDTVIQPTDEDTEPGGSETVIQPSGEEGFDAGPAGGIDDEPGIDDTSTGGGSPGGDTVEDQGVDRIQIMNATEQWQNLDDHDFVVDVIDFGEVPTPWIAMDYMDGGDIGERAGSMDLDQAMWTAVVVSEAVLHGHRQGVVHLGLKPENVLFRSVNGAWDVPKVSDWGLSNLFAGASAEGHAVHYRAPEQFDRNIGVLSEATDVYQLGTLIYELLTGERPYQGHPDTIREKVLTEELTPPSQIARVPAGIDEVLLKAMSFYPENRYSSVEFLVEDLRAIYARL